MPSNLITIDTPDDLILTDLERQIVQGLATKKSAKDLSIDLGIPRVAIMNLMQKKGVAEFVKQLIAARNQLMTLYLPDLLMDIIEAKVDANTADEEKGLADLSKKDVVDIARQLNEIIKTTNESTKTEADNKFLALYQQIDVIQQKDKSIIDAKPITTKKDK